MIEKKFEKFVGVRELFIITYISMHNLHYLCGSEIYVVHSSPLD